MIINFDNIKFKLDCTIDNPYNAHNQT